MLKAATESSGSVSLERKFLYFIDAKLKNQEIGYRLLQKLNCILKFPSSLDIRTLNLLMTIKDGSTDL